MPAPFLLSLCGVVWTAGFTGWVIVESPFLPGEETTTIYLASLVPLGLALVVFGLLSVACRWGNRAFLLAGEGLAGVLFVLAFLASPSLGMFVLPGAAALLAGAMLLEPRETRCA